jgi:hypothetical protein
METILFLIKKKKIGQKLHGAGRVNVRYDLKTSSKVKQMHVEKELQFGAQLFNLCAPILQFLDYKPRID